MNSLTFSQVIEQFYSALGEHLCSTSTFKVKNCFIRDNGTGKYIHMTVEIGERTIDMIISYDRFYQVPVLHYRVNGEVQCIHENSQLDIHPILQCPYAMLHPCETAAFMASTELSGLPYLVLWFNVQMDNLQTGIQLRL